MTFSIRMDSSDYLFSGISVKIQNNVSDTITIKILNREVQLAIYPKQYDIFLSDAEILYVLLKQKNRIDIEFKTADNQVAPL